MYTPIIFPYSTDPFQTEQDFTTDVVSEDSIHHVRQASSSRQAVASTVPAVLNLGSTASIWKQLQGLSPSVSRGSASVWKPMRDSNSDVSVEGSKDCVKTSTERQNLHKFLERQTEFAIRGENAAQRLSEAETDMEIKDLEKRKSELALYKSLRELELPRLRLRQANQWADQSRAEKISLCGQLEMKNTLHQEGHTRSCQETEKDGARQC